MWTIFCIGKTWNKRKLCVDSNPQLTPREQSSCGQHGAHLGPVGPRWAPCWPHEPCYQGHHFQYSNQPQTTRHDTCDILRSISQFCCCVAGAAPMRHMASIFCLVIFHCRVQLWITHKIAILPTSNSILCGFRCIKTILTNKCIL